MNSGPQSTNNYTLIDNLLWSHGRHNLTFGVQLQWLETNAASYAGFSGPLNLTYSGYNTENLNNLTGGSAYASFLVGALYTANVRTQSISDVGGRFQPIAPYVQDSWRVTPKLTITAGLRYDYLQPWHEVKNRFAFVNPDLVNPVTGQQGRHPVRRLWRWPQRACIRRIFASALRRCILITRTSNPSLRWHTRPTALWLFVATAALITTHAGGTGGHANATAGPGNNSEYAYTQVWQGADSTSPPAFFLNPQIVGSPQNSLFAPGSSAAGQADYASVPPFLHSGNVVDPLSTTGNYQIDPKQSFACASPTGGFATGPDGLPTGPGLGFCNPSTQNFVDPYYGGRGPQFINYNIGIQQMINKNAVLSINYVGSQTHFLPGGSGTRSRHQQHPARLAFFALSAVTVPANGTNPALTFNALTTRFDSLSSAQYSAVSAACPAFHTPYPGYSGPDATVAASLRPFPQFGNLTDIWGATGNSNYNALQIQVIQRPWHNLSGFFNYTWSKSIDDTGNHRTQFPVNPTEGNFTRSYTANGIDRGLGTFDQRNNFNGTFNYILPFGKGQQFLAANKLVGSVVGGWSVSGIIKLREGSPLQITTYNSGGCRTSADAYQGVCMPDYNPAVGAGQARINGAWGRAPGANASNIQQIQYLNTAAFQCPDLNCSSYKLGNVARSAPDGLHGPGWKDMDMAIRRTFQLLERGGGNVTMQVEADVANITNSTYFSLASGATAWNVCAAGQTTLQQCAALAYGTIGGQNSQVPPRDWQFSGRIRF